MIKNNLITAIHIDSSKVSAVTARVERDAGLIVVAHAAVTAMGVSRAMIESADEATASIIKVMNKIKEKTLGKIGDVYADVSGSAVKAVRAKGMVPLLLRGREVTRSDIYKCVDAAGTINLPFDRELIHKIPLNFTVDDRDHVKNPEGLYASRLGCEVYVISCNSNHLQNLHKCVSQAGYDIKEVIFSGIAEGKAFLEKDNSDECRAILKIEAQITEFLVYRSGALSHMAIFNIGSEDIGSDFRIDAALDGLMAGIRSEIEHARALGLNPCSVIAAGGIFLKEGFLEHIEDKLTISSAMGIVKGISGEISGSDSLKFATAIGICRHAFQERRLTARADRRMSRRLTTKIMDLINNYF